MSSNNNEVRRLEATLKRLKYAKSTIQIYVTYFSQFCNEINKPIKKVSKTDIENYLNAQQFGRSKQNQFINAIKAYFEKVLGQEKKLYKLIRPKKTRPLPKVIPQSELIYKLKQIPNLKAKTVLTTAYSSGLRISEVIQIKVDHIDSNQNVIHVKCSKNWKDRNVPLSPSVLHLLRKYYMKHKPTEYMFPGVNGGYISSSTARKYFKKYISKKLNFHSLRHSYATHMLDIGEGIDLVQNILGHEALKTTQIYAKVITRRFHNAKHVI